MSETTAEQKLAYRVRTADELYKALITACDVIWNGRAKPGQHVWSIPVDEVRDFDCILSDGINELLDLRTRVTQPPATLTREEAARELMANWRRDADIAACLGDPHHAHHLRRCADDLAALFPASEPKS